MSLFRAQNQGPHVKMEVELPVTFIEEGDSVVAYTAALDLSTCGKNKKEAMKMFSEAVKIFFNDLVENKTTDEVLTSLGWQKDEPRASWIPPKISQEFVGVKVPALV